MTVTVGVRPLDIMQDVHDRAVVLQVRGEVDSGSVGQLAEALRTAVAAAAAHPVQMLIVALDDVTYFGSAGLNALLDCAESGRVDGVAVRVVAGNAEVIRPIQVTKLDKVLRPHRTVADALASTEGL